MYRSLLLDDHSRSGIKVVWGVKFLTLQLGILQRLKYTSATVAPSLAWHLHLGTATGVRVASAIPGFKR
jgi:hypothetical protein